MFNWLKSLFSSKPVSKQEPVTDRVEDSQALVAEAPYVEGVTTAPVTEAPKAKKKRYYKPKPKAENGEAKASTSKPKAKKPAKPAKPSEQSSAPSSPARRGPGSRNERA